MAAPTLASVFERLVSKDKDLREMSTYDLIEMLKKPEWKRDTDQEKKLCELILKQLDDTSGDVSSLAVKCLGLLVRKVHWEQAERILDLLCARLVSGKKEQDREIASIALKTVINEISGAELSGLVVKNVVPKLLQGMQSKEHADLATASLDIMNDVLLKFGPMLGTEHTQLKAILLQELIGTRAGIRKRAITCLGSLVPYLSDALLDSVSLEILKELQGPGANSEATRVLIQALSAVGRAAGWRFGRHLDMAVPSVVEHWKAAGEGDDELRDYCLQALEAFVLRSPLDSKRHLDSIFDIAQQSLSYDPNYADDMEQDTEEDEEDEEAMSDDDFSDDDDTSWKVRRSAAKCLVAIINNYADLLNSLYPKVSPLLVARFKEREENVKIDVFHAFIELLHQVGGAASRDRASQAFKQLQEESPEVLKASFRQLRDKSLKTRAGVLLTLKELISVVPKCLSHDVEQLLPGLTAALNDRSSNSSQLRIQALQFLSVALEKSDPGVWQPHVPALSKPILTAVAERYSKVSAEGLRVCEALIHVIRPNTSSSVPPSLQNLVRPLLTSVKERLDAQDLDQEVKECAISCTATMLAKLAESLQADVPALLQVLLDRLRNSTTRLTAVKAFTEIAESPLPLDLSPVLEPLLAELTSYLRKANRQLRQASLAALESVMSRQGAAASSASVTAAVDEVVALVSDTDLLTTPLALHFCLTVLPQQPQNAEQIAAKFLPAALRLVKSPLLQGAALEELLALFPAILESEGTNTSFDSLLASLLAAGVAAETGKAAQHSVAQCIARMTVNAGADRISMVVKGLLGQLQSGNATWSSNGGEGRGRKRSATEESATGAESARRLALLGLGEIGRCTDLSAFPQLQQALTSALTSPSEQIKAAASLALGAVSIGNLDAYLPFVIQQINEQAANPKDQYLLLKALNEVIVSLTSDMGNKQLSPAHQQEVLRLLLANCEVEEECRNVVAECMGHLALLFPAEVLPALLQRHSDPSPSARAAAITAVKAAVVPGPHPIDDLLRDSIEPFLELMSDPDRGVRKAAVQMLSSAAHNKAALVAEQLPRVMPRVYAQTAVDQSLIRVVDLGPFKHKIDDGLELRKAAFEAMDVLLDNCVDRLDFQAFILHLESGLKDHYDVKLPCHLLLAKLASAAPGQLLSALDRLVEPLEKTLTARVKTDAVKQEVDRNEDMLRSALRATDAITRIPGVETCPPFKLLMDNTVLTGTLADRYKAVREERAEAEGTTSVPAMK
ncbi:TIP120-domain-containing protein [Coccomyxa subellipsoidea C-169]|uniref:TIP120-domain-containing protein n=1 Tax=Coccomyxa subellipsoidea (strain C-169) TaxID=574566 RepID=I0YRD1_COCSC|nr:TIP120-domain-containing protein [Coccomyxa subellipsoidea C-169]EIE20950.1 TIP120-domain-containing protein [Coccomyxa subellipsoidea C-169]|eukprot:XP_005645494.1 TIP120-domain-containing protein [Coccomyxa subellipsoidea C-169]